MRIVAIAKIVLWAVPASVIAASVGFWRYRRDHRVLLLGLSAVLTFFGYLFVPFDQGHGWGYRYFHSVWFVIPLLAALLFSSDQNERHERYSANGYLAACGLLSLTLLVPTAAYQVKTFIGQQLAYIPSVKSGKPLVTIISPGMGYYSADLVQNEPFLRGGMIMLVTHGRKDDAAFMAVHFPTLRLLAMDHRGSVWGYNADAVSPNSELVVPSENHADQE
jgi:hypothetical protein